MKINKKQTKRKKSGKVKAWECHLRCEFTKPNDSNKYYERCAIKIGISDLAKAKETMCLHEAVVEWIEEVKTKNAYKKDIVLKVDSWRALR
ncbi:MULTISPECIES: hypothetical protein [Cysteiniphilum]|uniref:Uncharacterized protein n=1 Tax=Cysteiniphilum litorale TaxID=2056700 RepID=A0A8J2Z2P6_9GAMM|nr:MULTISPECIES: hypothetical protein [Cysteiniphilum]GGF91747.1 hypothetical protein GCM10010995_06190 [Cysteiniphilum litorale]